MTSPSVNPIYVSVAAYVAATQIAESRGITVDQYVDQIITTIALPEILGLGFRQDDLHPLSPMSQGGSSRGVSKLEPKEEPEPKPKPKRKYKPRDGRKKKNWTCPVCDKKMNINGGRMHFLSCANKNGYSIAEVAAYLRATSDIGSNYGVFGLSQEAAELKLNTFIDACPTWFKLRESRSPKPLKRQNPLD